MLRIYLPAHPHYVLSELPALVTTLPSDTTHCDVFSPMSSGWITLDLESAYSVDSGASEVCLRISGLSDQDCPTFPALGVALPASSSKHPRSSSPGPGSPQHPSKRTKLDVVSTTAPITGPSTYVPSTPSTHPPKFPSGYSFSAVWNFVEATDTLRRDSRVDVVVALGNNLHGVTCAKATFNNIKQLLRCGDPQLWDSYHASGAVFSAYRAQVAGMPKNKTVLPWEAPAGPLNLTGVFSFAFCFTACLLLCF